MIEVDKRAKALIFDIDGTLADTMPAHYQAFLTVLGRYGIDFTPELFNSLAGIPVLPQMYMMKERFNPQNFDPERVAIEKETEFRKTISQTKPIKPVFEVLERYYKLMPIGCGTGGDGEVARMTLKTIGALDKVKAIVGCDDVKNGKPAPDTFLECARLLGVEPRFCQVFEDGVPGIEAAKAAGMMITDVRPWL